MGCYDTFLGELKCSKCGKVFKFEEQSKDYDCLLYEFKLGDYIDKANASYFYEMDTCCTFCNHKQFVDIAIKRGQIVGFYQDIESPLKFLETLDNIEEGYARNLEYKENCSNMLGYDKQKSIIKDYNIGDNIIVLEKDWIIDEIYKEVLDENIDDRLKSFYSLRYRENLILKVHCEDIKRLIILRKKEPIKVVIDTFEQKEKWDREDYYNRFISLMGTNLIKIK